MNKAVYIIVRALVLPLLCVWGGMVDAEGRGPVSKLQLSSGALNSLSRKPFVCNSSISEVSIWLPNADVKNDTHINIVATPEGVKVTAMVDWPMIDGVILSNSKNYSYPRGKSFKDLLNVINGAKLTRTRSVEADPYGSLSEELAIYRTVNGKKDCCFNVSHEPGNINVSGNYASVVTYMKSCVPSYNSERVALSDVLGESFGAPDSNDFIDPEDYFIP